MKAAIHLAVDGSDVEVDETYVGGVRKGKRGRGAEGKTPVLGMVQRKGRMKAVVVPDVKSKTVLPIAETTVEKGTRVHTDEYQVYNKLKDMGYYHHRILHSADIYVFGIIHTNTIEGFWAQIKNAVNGVHHGVATRYLQHYVNEYTFRYNHRNDVQPMFLTMLHKIVFNP
jgi:transposase-like protein